jgi:hypothetical protein
MTRSMIKRVAPNQRLGASGGSFVCPDWAAVAITPAARTIITIERAMTRLTRRSSQETRMGTAPLIHDIEECWSNGLLSARRERKVLDIAFANQ